MSEGPSCGDRVCGGFHVGGGFRKRPLRMGQQLFLYYCWACRPIFAGGRGQRLGAWAESRSAEPHQASSRDVGGAGPVVSKHEVMSLSSHFCRVRLECRASQDSHFRKYVLSAHLPQTAGPHSSLVSAAWRGPGRARKNTSLRAQRTDASVSVGFKTAPLGSRPSLLPCLPQNVTTGCRTRPRPRQGRRGPIGLACG